MHLKAGNRSKFEIHEMGANPKLLVQKLNKEQPKIEPEKIVKLNLIPRIRRLKTYLPFKTKIRTNPKFLIFELDQQKPIN